MNLKNWRFKIFALLFLAFIIFQSSTAFGLVNTLNTGWRANINDTKKVVHYIDSSNNATTSTCIINSNSSNDYFIPTNTYNEWVALTTKMASRGMALSTCCGDGICDANENGSNCSSDCASFACGDTFTDSRDNKEYPTVQIGTQCWMAKNMNLFIENQ